jgi:hypothetical protein
MTCGQVVGVQSAHLLPSRQSGVENEEASHRSSSSGNVLGRFRLGHGYVDEQQQRRRLANERKRLRPGRSKRSGRRRARRSSTSWRRQHVRQHGLVHKHDVRQPRRRGRDRRWPWHFERVIEWRRGFDRYRMVFAVGSPLSCSSSIVAAGAESAL